MISLIELHTLDLTLAFWGFILALVIAGATGRKRRVFLMGWAGSFHLAVTCLFGLFVISYLGTEAQIDMSLQDSIKKYFESWMLVERFTLPWDFVLSVPLPGGQLLMSMLAINLVMGGLLRVSKNLIAARTTRRKLLLSCLMVTHVGVVVLLAAGLVKLHLSETGHVTLFEGESTSEFVSFHEWEIVIFDAEATSDVQEWIIPASDFEDLESDSRSFTGEDLPFELILEHFVINGRLRPRSGDHGHGSSPGGDGWALVPEKPAGREGVNIAGILAKIRPKGSQATIPGILWAGERFPFTFPAGSKTWAMSLRHRIFELPGEIMLVDFHRELHPNTGMPRVFRSDVEWTELDAAGNPNMNKIRISMNEPLRRDGHALFQANWGPQDDPNAKRLYSQLEVTRNPSDHWPTLAVIIIGISMSLAMSIRLMGYMRQQASRRLGEGKS